MSGTAGVKYGKWWQSSQEILVKPSSLADFAETPTAENRVTI